MAAARLVMNAMTLLDMFGWIIVEMSVAFLPVDGF